MTIYEFVKAFALPPGSLVLLLMMGVFLLAIGWRRLGLWLTLVNLLIFYLLSTPYIASQLAKAVQSDRPSQPIASFIDPPEVIVVLAAGLLPYAPEYVGNNVDSITLQRLAYAAYLWRKHKIPILVSGGNISDTKEPPLAALMKHTLEQVFDVPASWVEGKSKNTYENAKFSAALLREQRITRILLVTHATHMPRANRLFRVMGLVVYPAPTIFTAPAHTFPESFLPRQSALNDSYYAIYELLGGLWYAFQEKDLFAPNAT